MGVKDRLAIFPQQQFVKPAFIGWELVQTETAAVVQRCYAPDHILIFQFAHVSSGLGTEMQAEKGLPFTGTAEKRPSIGQCLPPAPHLPQ